MKNNLMKLSVKSERAARAEKPKLIAEQEKGM